MHNINITVVVYLLCNVFVLCSLMATCFQVLYSYVCLQGVYIIFLSLLTGDFFLGLYICREFIVFVCLLNVFIALFWKDLCIYCMIQNFGGRKFWRIWRIARDSPKFSCPKFSHLKNYKLEAMRHT